MPSDEIYTPTVDSEFLARMNAPIENDSSNPVRRDMSDEEADIAKALWG